MQYYRTQGQGKKNEKNIFMVLMIWVMKYIKCKKLRQIFVSTTKIKLGVKKWRENK